MRFITMGQEAFPTLLFIPGLSATAESCYGKVGRSLQGQWHIVLCELDGHYEGSPPFSSIDAECEQIEAYVMENQHGRIHGMIGLSLGGTIAVSVLSRGNIQIERTVLDAAFCVDMGIAKGCYGWFFPKGVARIRDNKYVPGFLIDLFMGRGNRSMVERSIRGLRPRLAGMPAGTSIPTGSPISCETPHPWWHSGAAPGRLIQRKALCCSKNTFPR